ncbi:unnamed protein product [Closterium sp. NIES-65]|nr:unnamed protein product [Closterium sp. NIES-65]
MGLNESLKNQPSEPALAFLVPQQQAPNPNHYPPPLPPPSQPPNLSSPRPLPLPQALNFGGVASTESRVNPVFYNWNFVLLKYCDGASFAGSLRLSVSPRAASSLPPHNPASGINPCALNFGGVASTESRVNPVFYNWNFVLLKYCDGASFAGSAFGRPAKAHAPSNRGSSRAAAAAAVGGAEAAEAGGSGDPQTLFYMGHWNLQAAMQGCYARREREKGGGGRLKEPPVSLSCSSLLYMGHWNLQAAMQDLLVRGEMAQGTDAHQCIVQPAGTEGHESGDRRADLLVRRGMSQGTDALVGGCSAGAVAVSMVCDPIAAWLARYRIRTKCFMDAGVFPDVVDYYGQRSLRRKVQRMAAAQNINRAGISYSCKQSLSSSKEAWKCFFPEYNLNFVRTPMFLVNSLLDYKAVAIALAPRSKTHSNPLLRCMRSPRFSSCSALQLRLLRDFSHRVNSTIYGIVRARAAARVPFRAFTFSASTHCVIGSSYWTSLRMGMREADGGGGGGASALGVSVRDVKDIVGGGGVSDVLNSSGFEGGIGGGFGGGSREATLEGRFTEWYFS